MTKNLEDFEKEYYDRIYNELYQGDDLYFTMNKSFVHSREACDKFESLFKKDKPFTNFAIKFMQYKAEKGDVLTSDRELAALYLAYQENKMVEAKVAEIFKKPYDPKKDPEFQKTLRKLTNSLKGKRTRAPAKKCSVKVNFRKML